MEAEKIATEMANFAGLSHAGIPVMMRGSVKIPTAEAINAASSRIAAAVRGALSPRVS